MFKSSKKRKGFRQTFAWILSLAMILSNFTGLQVSAAEDAGNVPSVVSAGDVSGGDAGKSTSYVLEAKDLNAFAQGDKSDGDTEKAGTDGYFTLYYSAKTKVDSSDKTFEDAYSSKQRINWGTKSSFGDVIAAAAKFETNNTATVKVWWVCGGDGREVALFNQGGEVVTKTSEGAVKNSLYISELSLEEAGTYFLGSAEGSNYIFKIEVSEDAPAEPEEYVLDATKDLEAVAQGSKKNGETQVAGTEDFFTLFYSEKTKVDGSDKTFDDSYAGTQRINFGTKSAFGDVISAAVKFETNNAATVKIWWVCGGDGREVALFNNAGTVVTKTEESAVKNSLYISELSLEEAGTYFLGSAEGSNYIFKIQVVVSGGGSVVKPPRADWSTVEAPVIVSAEQLTDKESEDYKDNTIEVKVNANVGYDGADKITVTMKDEAGEVVASKNSSKEDSSHTLTFNPTASGNYTFSVVAIRDGEEDKAGAETKTAAFVLKLEAPYVSSATNVGGGDVTVKWSAVAEATAYVVTVDGTDISITTSELSATVKGLTIGQKYTIKVVALRSEETSKEGSIEVNVVDEVQRTWDFVAFGQGVNTTNNKASGTVYDNNLVVESTSGKGKLVPASTDGLAFYYTTIDPETENFTLSADVTVDEWTYSNGQEGFGIMAADAIGAHGDSSVFWNNSYMATVTKVEYLWDKSANAVSDSGDKYSMYLGVGAQEKRGVSAENIDSIKAGDLSAFSSKMYALDATAAKLGLASGSYNMVANITNSIKGDNLPELVSTFHLEIQRNNTGYFLTFTDAEGNETTKKFYHDDEKGDELTRIDKDNIYVGFFASRNAKVSIKNVELTTINPADDELAEERPITTVTPNFSMESAKIANSSEYELVYYGNADGTLTIEGPAGAVVTKKAVTANTKVKIPTTLSYGENAFVVTFDPDENYKPSKYEVMGSYETVKFNFTVKYEVNEGNVIYISPEGSSSANGTKQSPMDIYTAVEKAAPGQYLVLMEGTYNLSRTVIIERGINGSADNMIYLVADPEATGRPVLDFNGNCAGMILAGDYWYLQGFDVTESAKAQKGLQISGDNNVIDQIHAYRNGNTGIQISRFKGTDLYEDWPSNNLVLNCTSYLNADPGYEDADGFAAKLTIADGNVFDGCIAAYNADDGWDLFAKIESGPIGKVVIKNSIAFKNGYDIDESGNEINAGNGNGFKMGGSSIVGGHILENSIAFANKAKGIDSNSCPDINVVNCTSFNNGSYNVALYTNDAANTDYSATGIISFKDGKNGTEGENIKPKGSQDTTKIYTATNYFFPDGNTEGVKATAEWFVNLDTDAAVKSGISRYADATINMNGYLVLTDVAADAGAVLEGNGTASPVIALPEVVVPTPETTPAPVVTAAPSTDSDKDDEPTATPSVEEVVKDIASATANAANGILNADSWEEVKEAVSAFVNTVIQMFKELPYVSVDAAMSLSSAEAAIAAKGGVLKIDDSGAEKVGVTGVANGLFTVPEGGQFVVKDTTLSAEQKKAAMKCGISQKQMENAYPIDMGLFDKNNNAVQPLVPMVVTFKLPDAFKGKDVKLLHYAADKVEVLEVEENGSVGRAVVSGFSTFALIEVGDSKAPKTSDIFTPQVNAPVAVSAERTNSVLPWICLAVAVLTGIAAVITGVSIFRKKEDE